MISSCGEERISEDYIEYAPKKLADNDGNVTYTNLTTFPIIGDISSNTPTVDVEGESKFILGDITAPSGSTINNSKFSIDNKTGVITYDNGGELSPGTYYVDVKLGYLEGLVTYENALQIDVTAVPVTLEVDNTNPSAGIFEQGVVATASYTDTSGSGLITSVEYALVNAPQGFSIDKNSGEISKSYPANSGENPISVKITTNLGAVTVENLTKKPALIAEVNDIPIMLRQVPSPD